MAPKKTRVVLHPDAVKKLGKDKAVTAELRKAAKKLARKANATTTQKQPYPDYDSDVDETGDHPHAAVYTRSKHAKYSNAKHQTLAKLL